MFIKNKKKIFVVVCICSYTSFCFAFFSKFCPPQQQLFNAVFRRDAKKVEECLKSDARLSVNIAMLRGACRHKSLRPEIIVRMPPYTTPGDKNPLFYSYMFDHSEYKKKLGNEVWRGVSPFDAYDPALIIKIIKRMDNATIADQWVIMAVLLTEKVDVISTFIEEFKKVSNEYSSNSFKIFIDWVHQSAKQSARLKHMEPNGFSDHPALWELILKTWGQWGLKSSLVSKKNKNTLCSAIDEAFVKKQNKKRRRYCIFTKKKDKEKTLRTKRKKFTTLTPPKRENIHLGEIELDELTSFEN